MVWALPILLKQGERFTCVCVWVAVVYVGSGWGLGLALEGMVGVISVWVWFICVYGRSRYLRILGAPSVQSCCTLSVSASYRVFVCWHTLKAITRTQLERKQCHNFHTDSGSILTAYSRQDNQLYRCQSRIVYIMCCCCRPKPPCLFGGILPYFEVTGHPVPVSSLGFKCPDCFIWNCSYIVYPSKMKGPFGDNCLRNYYLWLEFLMAGWVEAIRRALVLGLALIAGTAIEQAPSIGSHCIHHHRGHCFTTYTGRETVYGFPG